jgi:hypothetical protein
LLKVKLPFISYHRILAENVTPEQTVELKKDDYSFIVSYGGFCDNDYQVTDKNSCLINLEKDIDQVLAGFNPTSRNEVRRAEKITELKFHTTLNDFDFDEYYKFHTSCEHDRNWFPVPPEELKQSIVFSATHNGILIAGMSCYTHENRIRVGRIYSNKRSKQSNILTNLVYGVASKRIVFEICKYGITNNFSTLDLGGVDLNTPEKSGITKFKLSLGGEVVPVKLARFTSSKFVEAEKQIKANGWDLT